VSGDPACPDRSVTALRASAGKAHNVAAAISKAVINRRVTVNETNEYVSSGRVVQFIDVRRKGEYENVRFEARPKDVDRVGNWMWENNQFQNTSEFRALKILMVMINNWDMKDDNNEILAMRNPTTGEAELRYIISDLGGTFGKTGGFFSRSRNAPKDYVKADFIKAVNGDVIDFNYGGKNQKLFSGITVADARWLSDRFKGLSDEQIKDAFRSANYTPEEVDTLTNALKVRIAALADPAGAVAKDNK